MSGISNNRAEQLPLRRFADLLSVSQDERVLELARSIVPLVDVERQGCQLRKFFVLPFVREGETYGLAGEKPLRGPASRRKVGIPRNKYRRIALVVDEQRKQLGG